MDHCDRKPRCTTGARRLTNANVRLIVCHFAVYSFCACFFTEIGRLVLRWCTRTPAKHAGGHDGGTAARRDGVRVFKQFPWLKAGSVKAALSRPTHQRVTPAVG